MVRSLTFALATVGAAAVLFAQAPAPDQPAGGRPGAQAPSTQQPATPAPNPSTEPSQRPSTPMSSASGEKATWRGCVKPGATPGSWILESAELAPAAGASSPVGTAGAGKSTFILSTKPGDDLKAHANHKIEVTGTVAPASSSSPSSASSSSSTARQTFNVDSFKMVSATCP
jgi:hypothetical protein